MVASVRASSRGTGCPDKRRHEFDAPEPNAPAVDGPFHAVAGNDRHVDDVRQRDFTGYRFAEGARQRMLGMGIQRSSERQRGFGRGLEPRRPLRMNTRHGHPAHRQGSGLVEDDVRDARQRLQRVGARNDDLAPRERPRGRRQRGRRRERQRART